MSKYPESFAIMDPEESTTPGENGVIAQIDGRGAVIAFAARIAADRAGRNTSRTSHENMRLSR